MVTVKLTPVKCIFTQGNLWDRAFADELQNIRDGKEVGTSQRSARELAEYLGDGSHAAIIEAEKQSPILVTYNKLLGKIGLGELEFVEQATELAKTHEFDQKELGETIQGGARERFSTLSMWINAGYLTHVLEAKELIKIYGEDERVGEEKRSVLLERNIERGEKTAATKREILLEDGIKWQAAYI